MQHKLRSSAWPGGRWQWIPDDRMRSSPTTELELDVPRMLHLTIGDRTFPVAAARVWNSLPPVVTLPFNIGLLPLFAVSFCSVTLNLLVVNYIIMTIVLLRLISSWRHSMQNLQSAKQWQLALSVTMHQFHYRLASATDHRNNTISYQSRVLLESVTAECGSLFQINYSQAVISC